MEKLTLPTVLQTNNTNGEKGNPTHEVYLYLVESWETRGIRTYPCKTKSCNFVDSEPDEICLICRAKVVSDLNQKIHKAELEREARLRAIDRRHKDDLRRIELNRYSAMQSIQQDTDSAELAAGLGVLGGVALVVGVALASKK